MELRIKKLTENAVIPQYMSKGAAGLDLTATTKSWDNEKQVLVYGTGLSVEIPRGHVGLLFPRSSIFKTGLTLTNAVGVIDSDYRGEIKAVFTGQPGKFLDAEYNIGDRIVQLVVMPFPSINITEVKELSNTERGAGGFGHTGK